MDVPVRKDVGKRISVRVSGVKSGYVTASEMSSQTTAVTRSMTVGLKHLILRMSVNM